jgi:hypothetical protein
MWGQHAKHEDWRCRQEIGSNPGCQRPSPTTGCHPELCSCYGNSLWQRNAANYRAVSKDNFAKNRFEFESRVPSQRVRSLVPACDLQENTRISGHFWARISVSASQFPEFLARACEFCAQVSAAQPSISVMMPAAGGETGSHASETGSLAVVWTNGPAQCQSRRIPNRRSCSTQE